MMIQHTNEARESNGFQNAAGEPLTDSEIVENLLKLVPEEDRPITCVKPERKEMSLDELPVNELSVDAPIIPRTLQEVLSEFSVKVTDGIVALVDAFRNFFDDIRTMNDEELDRQLLAHNSVVFTQLLTQQRASGRRKKRIERSRKW